VACLGLILLATTAFSIGCGGSGSSTSTQTLGSYRDYPGRRGRVAPSSFGRGSFDRIVCTEPLAFAAGAVIYLWDFNGRHAACVGFAGARSGESGGADSGSGCDGGPTVVCESAS
jgi:hypothetical protein